MRDGKRVESLKVLPGPTIVDGAAMARPLAIPRAQKPVKPVSAPKLPRPAPESLLSDEPIVDALVASYGRVALELGIGVGHLLQVMLERPHLFLRALLRARKEFEGVYYARPKFKRRAPRA